MIGGLNSHTFFDEKSCDYLTSISVDLFRDFWSILLIDTLYEILINTWSTCFQWHLDWHSIDIPSTSRATGNLNFWSMCKYELVDTWLTIDLLLIKCQLNVNWESIRKLIEYQLKCWLRVLINFPPWIPLVHTTLVLHAVSVTWWP